MKTDENRAVEQDNRLQIDPELSEGRSGFGRIALTAIVAVAVVIAVVYGMNSQTPQTTGSTPTAAGTPPAPVAPPATARSETGQDANSGQSRGQAASQSQAGQPAAAPSDPSSQGGQVNTATEASPGSDKSGTPSDRGAKPAQQQ